MNNNYLFIISSLHFGGAETQTVADANMLAESGTANSIHLLYFSDGPLSNRLNPSIHKVLFSKTNYFTTAYQLAKYTADHKIDIIHAALFAPMITAALASLWSKAKIIWHFHSHEYDMPFKSKMAFKYLARLPQVKSILFVSEELRTYFLRKLNLPEHKLETLYNHSEITILPTNITPINKVHIGFIGRVIPIKRIELLIQLAQFLLNNKKNEAFLIHIVGDGSALNQLKRQVEEAGLNPFFVFHGFQNKVADYYSRFDIFINPSSEECLSIAMIDAAMYGLPIVAFNVGGNSEIVEHSHTGFIVDDISAFNRNTLELINDLNLRKEQGLKARNKASTYFGIENHKKKLLSIYNNIVNE